MITISSNINDFISKYKNRVNKINAVLGMLAERLAQRMSADMKELIDKDRRWQEDGNLSRISQVDFRVETIENNKVRVHVGENLPKFVMMNDGTLVNPAFFIEFGFGIVGEQNPKQNHSAYNWEYNINGHKTSWFFRYEGKLIRSSGREGVNFIYTIMQEYKNNWEKYFRDLLSEIDND